MLGRRRDGRGRVAEPLQPSGPPTRGHELLRRRRLRRRDHRPRRRRPARAPRVPGPAPRSRGRSSRRFDAGGLTLSRAPALLPPLDEPPAARVFKELDCGRAGQAPRPRGEAPASRRAPRPADRLLDGCRRDGARARAGVRRGPRPPCGIAIERLGAVGAADRSAARERHHPAAERLLGAARGRTARIAAAETAHRPLRAARRRAPVPDDRGEPGRALHRARAARDRRRSPRRAPSSSPAAGPHLVRGRPRPACTSSCSAASTPSAAIGASGCSPVEIVVRRGRAVGVRVLPRDETIGCHHLIWAGSSATPAPRPSARPRPRPSVARARCASPATVTRSRCSASPGAIPDGTPPRIIAIGDPSRPLTEDNALAITVGRRRPRGAPQRIPLWVECVVPAHAVEAGPGYLRALRGRLIHTLGRLLPTLPSRLALMASAYDGLPAEPRARSAGATPPADHRRRPPRCSAVGDAAAARRHRPSPRHRRQEPLPRRAREPPRPRPRGRAHLRLGRGAPRERRPRPAQHAPAPHADRQLRPRLTGAPAVAGDELGVIGPQRDEADAGAPEAARRRRR